MFSREYKDGISEIYGKKLNFVTIVTNVTF